MIGFNAVRFIKHLHLTEIDDGDSESSDFELSESSTIKDTYYH